MNLTSHMFNFSDERVTEIIWYSYDYLGVYPTLIKLAQDNNFDEKTRQSALALATYGWMPTIPKKFTDSLYIEKVARVSSREQALEFVRTLKAPIINNSWVGTSKILHFIQPKYFPIWDRKVSVRTGISDNFYQMSKHENYTKYVDAIDAELVDACRPLATAIELEFGYLPSTLRCLELELFTDVVIN